MTRKERSWRNRRIAELYFQGKTVPELADLFDVQEPAIRYALRGLTRQWMEQISSVWLEYVHQRILQTGSTTVVATELGVTCQWVRSMIRRRQKLIEEEQAWAGDATGPAGSRSCAS